MFYKHFTLFTTSTTKFPASYITFFKKSTRKMAETISDNSNNIKTFVFFDLETTGLPKWEYNKTKITEMSFVAVLADHMKSGVLPRVQNKLNLCVYPRKRISDGAERMTGLDNFLLETSQVFSEQTVTLLDNFLSHLPKPICLVAHNGNNFDFPILRAEIMNTNSTFINDDMFCVDSLDAFRQIMSEDKDNEDTVDFLSGISDNIRRNEVSSEILEIDDDSPTKTVPYSETTVVYCDNSPRSETKSIPCSDILEIDCDNSTNATPDIEKDVSRLLTTETSKALKHKKTIESTPEKSATNNPAKRVKTSLFSNNRFKGGFTLQEIFKILYPLEKYTSHIAEHDVYMLLKCAIAKHREFVNWANENAKIFKDIPAMTPGKKIGT